MTLRDELDQVKRELCARERAKCAHMTRTEYGRYIASLSKAQRDTHRQMMASSDEPPRMNPARSAEALDMDRRMGLTQPKLGCKREGSTMRFGVVVDDSATSAPRAAAARQRGTHTRTPAAAPQRPTGRCRPTELSDPAVVAELDRRMGTGTRAGCVQRTPTSLTFSAGSSK